MNKAVCFWILSLCSINIFTFASGNNGLPSLALKGLLRLSSFTFTRSPRLTNLFVTNNTKKDTLNDSERFFTNYPIKPASIAAVSTGSISFLSLKTITKLFPVPILKETTTIFGASAAIGICSALGLSIMLLQRQYTDKKFAKTYELHYKTHTKIDDLALAQQRAFESVEEDFLDIKQDLREIEKQIHRNRNLLQLHTDESKQSFLALNEKQQKTITIVARTEENLQTIKNALAKNKSLAETTLETTQALKHDLQDLKAYIATAKKEAETSIVRRIKAALNTTLPISIQIKSDPERASIIKY